MNVEDSTPGSIPPKASIRRSSTISEDIFGSAYDHKVVKRFTGYLSPYRKLIIFSMLTVLLFSVTAVLLPLIVKYTIDSALVAGVENTKILTICVTLFFTTIALNFVGNYLQELIIGRIGERVLIQLRRSMFEHLQRVSLSFMDKTQVGSMMSRLQGDVGALQEFLHTITVGVGDIILILGVVLTLFFLDWRLALMMIGVVPALLLIRVIWLPFARKAFIRSRVTASIVSGSLAENINGIRAVQGLTREKVNYSLFDILAHDNLAAQNKAARFGVIMMPIVDTLTGIALAVIIFGGGLLVSKGNLEVGVMVAFMLYVQRFFDPIRQLTMHYSIFQRAMAAGERIFEVIDVPIEVKNKPNAVTLKNIDGSIEFKNVTFGYVPDEPILTNISFKVEPGETVALVGPTGSGKTSITSLTHRFYDVWEGEVFVGGKNVKDVTQSSLSQQVGMVLQEPFLFTGTVIENIRYVNVDCPLSEVVEAAKAVGAHNFICQLPDGYDSMLEQRGGNISLGQRQLLSFARAIVANTKILILDEATASVDSYTEMLIQDALSKLLKGRTGMVIAHRLATIRSADRIIVLQDGKIIETGTHDELVTTNGLYSHMYSLNYSSFDDIPDDLIKEVTREWREGIT
ncbi:MAG: ABC transporter ATP-binding protein [SAR202 cluster bacterium]|jgi:ATP-binding cassette subfamily B protein|nr:multidrug ABC transporter [Chloroflexota bacterium]MDP7231416.1 ABC transporter ATP-binding protein [Dehalococcoidia bacterium]MDP7612373.1 ABC transporter ATP-binding protein [Dehalococcoidia bacterium]MQG46795.1 ABC transporter ATP-binding protein [SAR202 cluster bacterium]|tara:strand:+ start:1545 stop:3431 length:1887 start_codon:yes stop_codon:yes gene_type:complete